MEVEKFTIKRYTDRDERGLIEFELEGKADFSDYKLTLYSHYIKPEKVVIESIGISDIKELNKFLTAFLKGDAIDVTEEE